jgi:hypothetical protein
MLRVHYTYFYLEEGYNPMAGITTKEIALLEIYKIFPCKYIKR